MSRCTAPLTLTGRLRLARCTVDDGWEPRGGADRYCVWVPTAQRQPGPRAQVGWYGGPLPPAPLWGQGRYGARLHQ